MLTRHVVVLAITVFSSQVVFAGDLKTRLLKCVTLENAEQRVNCYDDIGNELLASEEDAVEKGADEKGTMTPEVAVPVAVEKDRNNSDTESYLPAELGGEQFKKTTESPNKQSKALARGRVTSCKRAVDGKWFFIFENGQIWKQVGSRRRNYRSCDFLITIKKDGIGFKMQVDGEKSTLRIKRQR